MFNMKKFNSLIESKENLTNDDVKVREILELCSKSSITLTYDLLKEITSTQLLLVYREIYKKPLLEKEVIKDMINGQYLIENLSYVKQTIIDDDEEIY